MRKLLKLSPNISSTFPLRSKCRHCMSSPNRYYCLKSPTLWFSPESQNKMYHWIKRNINRTCLDLFTNFSFKIDSVSEFSHPVNYKGFRPKLHKNKWVHPFMEYIDILVCKCGKTSWAFYQRSSKNRPEIYNRKGKYDAPIDYEHF